MKRTRTVDRAHGIVNQYGLCDEDFEGGGREICKKTFDCELLNTAMSLADPICKLGLSSGQMDTNIVECTEGEELLRLSFASIICKEGDRITKYTYPVCLFCGDDIRGAATLAEDHCSVEAGGHIDDV